MSNESITLISLVLLVLVAILYNRIHNTPQKKLIRLKVHLVSLKESSKECEEELKDLLDMFKKSLKDGSSEEYQNKLEKLYLRMCDPSSYFKMRAESVKKEIRVLEKQIELVNY